MNDLTGSFKALGHENRLRIMQLLMEKEYYCCSVDSGEECSMEEPECNFGELLDILGIHKSTLSHHLKELRYAGLIETIKEGRNVSVRVNREKMKQLKEFFDPELLAQPS